MDNLLLEKISLAAIARVANVSKKCLQDYVKAHYAENPLKAQLSSKKGKIILQYDEVCSLCWKQREQTMDLVSLGCQHERNCW